MALEDLIKEATSTFSAQLQEALEGMAEDLGRAAADDRTAAVARATDELKRQLAEAQAASKADVDRAVGEQVARAREDAEEAALAKIEEARAEAKQAADAEVVRVRHEAEAAVELARARAEAAAEQATVSTLTDVVAGERQRQLLCTERLLAIIRRLDQAASLTDVLAALAEGAAAEAPRVAVLTLHGQHARGWRFHGFSPDPCAVDLDLAQAGVIGRAVSSGEVALAEPAVPGQAQPAGPAFATLPADRSGLAVPLIVGGAPVAVIYADDVTDEEQMKPASWPEAIEILARHAAVRLENLTATRTAQVLGMGPQARESAGAPGASAGAVGPTDDEGARRYARLLVSEIKLYNEAAVRVGRQKRDLLERLGPEITRARRLFNDRVPPDVRARRDDFDQELVQTLADGDASLLGRRSDALA